LQVRLPQAFAPAMKGGWMTALQIVRVVSLLIVVLLVLAVVGIAVDYLVTVL
jgi:hypothetical protein